MVLSPAAMGLAVLSLGLCACDRSEAGSADGEPYVVATTSIWGDVVGEVVCDGSLDVRTLIPSGGDPHAYEPSLRDRETLDEAALVVTNGLGLEDALSDTLDSVAAGDTPKIAVGDHVKTLSVDGRVDPHIWFDPTRVAAALPALGEALVGAGADQQVVARCTAGFERELVALDRDVAATLAAIPDDRRTLVTNHDSLGYFAERYDLTVLGTVLPSTSTLTAANPADLESLAAQIDATGVPAIFAEELGSADDARRLAERLDIEVVSLYTDALGELGSPADHYIGLLRADARLIADALGE